MVGNDVVDVVDVVVDVVDVVDDVVVVTPSGWGTKGATGSKGILNPGISLWFWLSVSVETDELREDICW